MGASQQSQTLPYIPEKFNSDSFDDDEFSSCSDKDEVLEKFLTYKQEFESNYSDTKAKLVFANRGTLDKFLAKVKVSFRICSYFFLSFVLPLVISVTHVFKSWINFCCSQELLKSSLRA